VAGWRVGRKSHALPTAHGTPLSANALRTRPCLSLPDTRYFVLDFGALPLQACDLSLPASGARVDTPVLIRASSAFSYRSAQREMFLGGSAPEPMVSSHLHAGSAALPAGALLQPCPFRASWPDPATTEFGGATGSCRVTVLHSAEMSIWNWVLSFPCMDCPRKHYEPNPQQIQSIPFGRAFVTRPPTRSGTNQMRPTRVIAYKPCTRGLSAAQVQVAARALLAPPKTVTKIVALYCSGLDCGYAPLP